MSDETRENGPRRNNPSGGRLARPLLRPSVVTRYNDSRSMSPASPVQTAYRESRRSETSGSLRSTRDSTPHDIFATANQSRQSTPAEPVVWVLAPHLQGPESAVLSTTLREEEEFLERMTQLFLDTVEPETQEAFEAGERVLQQIRDHVAAFRAQHNIREVTLAQTQGGESIELLSGQVITRPIEVTSIVGFQTDNIQTAMAMLVEQVGNEESRIREFLEFERNDYPEYQSSAGDYESTSAEESDF